MTNTWRQALTWYKKNQTTEQIGFNPNGMCLKVCRVARNIPAMYPSAKVAQDATPDRYRVHEVRNLRKGMVLYFDTVGDDNPYGHVCTMIGRVKGFDWNDLNDVLVETNSVKSGELVVVRASYFKKYWNDDFKFGATWLNGYEIDYLQPQDPVKNFINSGPDYRLSILDNAIKNKRRVDLRYKRNKLEELMGSLTEDGRRLRIVEARELFTEKRIINMTWLRNAVREVPDDKETARVVNKIDSVIKSLFGR